MQLWMRNITPNYAYMGYTDSHLAESLFTNASGTSSSAVDLYTAHLVCCSEAREWMIHLFFSPRDWGAVSFLDKKKNK